MTGRWPTAASHDHLHHVLQKAGLSAGATTAVLWVVAALGTTVGIAGMTMAISESTLFYSFLGLFAVYAVVMALT